MSTSIQDGLRYVLEHAMNYGTVPVALTSILILYLIRSLGGTRGNIRHILGPPSPSWTFGQIWLQLSLFIFFTLTRKDPGHMLQLLLPPTYGYYEFDWQKLYGPVYRTKGCFGQDRLMVSDSVSLQYILNSPDFTFGPTLENALYFLFGMKSLMGANDHNHKRLRAALNVGFTAAAVRNYLAVFEKAAQSLTEQLEDTSAVPLDVCPLLSISTLSTISEVVLGYPVKALGEDFMSKNFEIADYITRVIISNQSAVQIVADSISTRLPTWVRRAAINIPTQTFRVIRATKRLSEALGAQVVREKTDAAQQGLEIDTDFYGHLVEQRRSDKNALTEEIVAQTALILEAGQDTTANTLVFGLLELARALELQEKLRAEIHSMGGSKAYDSMPLLNAVIKETLRMYPAIPLAERMAVRDMLIPLADPIPMSTRESMSHIHVRKGQVVSLGIASYHRQESRWGEDAHEFNPSRWLSGMTTTSDALGPYANLSSKFSLGAPGMSRMAFCITRDAGLPMRVGRQILEDDAARPRYAATMMPALRDGKRGAPLCVRRMV
ncbi:cytochrome P450 [Mycena leptocephala]|nr:cytochrome P450 [Mycena leptocephala]